MKPHLAIFDFDGTITDKDSFIDFILFSVGPARSVMGFISLLPVLITYKLGLTPNHKAKEAVISHFFKGWPKKKFTAIARQYPQRLPKILRLKAMAKIQWHKQQGHYIVIATASLEDYLQEWCKQEQLDLIATRLEEEGGTLTGKLAGKNCYGEEKVNRLKQKYNLQDFEKIYAYGDSPADKALESIANEFHYKPFV